MMEDMHYITIMGWMRKIPEITTNTELMAYALIYGFSQTDGQYLTCKQAYIAEWLGMSRPKCNGLIKRMESKGLIRKILVRQNGSIRKYKYCCIVPSATCYQREHDESPKGTRTSYQREHAYNIYNHIDSGSDKNLLYISHPARDNKNQFCDFPRQDYNFEQIEMELLSGLTQTKAEKESDNQ